MLEKELGLDPYDMDIFNHPVSQGQVTAWQSPNGETICICPRCEVITYPWPKDSQGEEYCQVHYGIHKGICNICGG